MTGPADRDGYLPRGPLRVAADFVHFIEAEALPGTGIAPARFWSELDAITHELGPQNRFLLERRTELQSQIDDWHRRRLGAPIDAQAYEAFLKRIGYLAPDEADFEIDNGAVDPEIATIAGPHMVAPASNPRAAMEAANARWGSLTRALLASDVIGAANGPRAEAGRAARAAVWALDFLDHAAPLENARYIQIAGFRIAHGALAALRDDGSIAPLTTPAQFAGYRGAPDAPDALLLRCNGLHIELSLDAGSDRAGRRSPIRDLVLESAVSTLIDLEDTVAAVDVADKVRLYRTWLGLMRGDLSVEARDAAAPLRLAGDRFATTGEGAPLRLRGRSLLLLRTVGHAPLTAAVLDETGAAIPEGMLDTLTAATIALHDLAKPADDPTRNSRVGAAYLVKPKMHGPDEVAFADMLFGRVEEALGLRANTLKLGVMDAERRTTINLKACIKAARQRICLLHSNCLDRAGGDIHTSMEAGPMTRKDEMRAERRVRAIEDWELDVGLACGFRGRAQIGRGMWPAPARMRAMLERKIDDPAAGASAAGAPTPTAATLHATHYHRIDVTALQGELSARIQRDGPRARLADLLRIPLADRAQWDAEDIQAEIDANAHAILGYVARWVDQGIGCATLRDIENVERVQDRADCRISSQLLANWLHQGVVEEDQMLEALKRMAALIDRQNRSDPDYRPMGPKFSASIAFQAACDLIFQGREQPSGYADPILTRRRLERKAIG